MSKNESLITLCRNMKKLREHYGSMYTLNRIEQEDFPKNVDCKLLVNLSIHFRYRTETLLNENILL